MVAQQLEAVHVNTGGEDNDSEPSAYVENRRPAS